MQSTAAALSFAVANLHDELHSDDVRQRVRRWTVADFEPQQAQGVALAATLDAYNEMKRQVSSSCSVGSDPAGGAFLWYPTGLLQCRSGSLRSYPLCRFTFGWRRRAIRMGYELTRLFRDARSIPSTR